jgi:hypothetical protein
MTTTLSSQTTTSAKLKRLPLQDVGLNNLVAVPYLLTLTEPHHTMLRLAEKEVEATPVPYWYSNSYTVNGTTATSYEFMYGKKPPHLISHAISAIQGLLETGLEGAFKSICTPEEASSGSVNVPPPVSASSLTSLSLDNPEQFAMALPNYQGIYDLAKPYLASFVSALTNVEDATKQFWPTLGNFSFMHNLLILERVQDVKVESVRSRFAEAWIEQNMESLYDKAATSLPLDESIRTSW